MNQGIRVKDNRESEYQASKSHKSRKTTDSKYKMQAIKGFKG